jgi:3-dehydroquinate dehydratase/shikimate dehydrogenase
MMLAEHKHLVDSGARLVELRVDYVRRAVSIIRLLAERPCPVVITCRRTVDGGKWRGSEQSRIMVLRTAIVEGADFVDIEEDIADKIPRYGKTKRIISYHNFRETPDDLEKIRDRMLKCDPDIIKITTMANRPTDNIRVLKLAANAKVPTIAFCMGEIGMPSRILCRKFGAPFTYASFNSERLLAPGQLSYKDMMLKYRIDRINKETVVYGVIADPVGHSMSPAIHNACLRKEKMNAIYLPFRVPREDLHPFLDACQELDVKGLSVTIPHKEQVLRSINALDENVAGIRACNTLVFNRGKVFGYNTDCEAAISSLIDAEESENPKTALKGRVALVLGSGGVAKAIVFGLVQAGAKVLITSRNTRAAELLAADYKCLAVDWIARHNVVADYLVNCTPVGMHPDVNESPFDRDGIKSEMVVFDTVYNPEQTLLIKYAREAHCRVVTGVEMFVRQAARQFELFTGKPANVEFMRSEMKRAISAARY